MGEEINIDKYLENKDTKIVLFPEKIEREFTTINQLKEFIDGEMEFWGQCNQGRANEIKNHFNDIKSDLDNFSRYSNSEYNANNYLSRVLSNLKIKRFPLVFSETQIGKFILEQYDISYLYADAAIDYLINFNNSLSYLSNKEYFEGVLEAYKYSNQEIAFTKLEDNLAESILEIKEKIIKTHDDLYKVSKDYHQNLIESYNNFSGDISNWRDTIKSEVESYLEDKVNTFKDLEIAYKEKLKLEAPIEYWGKLHNDYNKKGRTWTGIAISTSVIMMILLIVILYNIPSQLDVNLDKFSFQSLRATLILALIISIGVYLIRLFVKLALSAYHLSRDAKERYQLTYVYLALINEGTISEQDRNIVLQALFSRADTGLLKGDSSPTLPDGMINQLTKLISK
ncbi:DUF6161 domain-containing protein [uncultured Clostridium sp.]|uniref:DUF6161 domain-containing protein n=1 Tax=uncultured Clostridium sp. TaxID=59620 RepID=UPI0025857A46|nr:DUF6161 domain-containing protein [uncultured Clostridium sp.]